MWLAFVSVLASVGSVEHTAVSPNFLVRSPANGPAAREVASLCEQARTEVHATWFGEPAKTTWRPTCEIVVHRESKSYLAAVGWAGVQTQGSSAVRFRRQEVLSRRIDLLLDAHGELPDCVSHEVAHMVLADRFAGKPLPRWADEGIASWSDSPAKRARYREELYRAARQQRLLPLVQLLTTDRYPSGDMAVFYGQSVVLVDYLLERGSTADLIDFIETVRQRGYDTALRQIYRIDGVGELERLYRGFVYERLRSDGTLAEIPRSLSREPA